jgi:hypothetical protein
MSLGDSGGGQTVQQVKSDPWSGLQPYLKQGFQQAETDVLNRPQEYFPGSSVVPFSPQTQAALTQTENRALAGSPLNQQAQQQTMQNLSGDYLAGGNPAYGAMVERSISPLRSEFQNVVMPGVTSSFAAGGRYGSPGGMQSAQQRAGDQYMRAVGDTSAGLAYQNYGDERTRMMQASALAPELANQDYQDISMLGQVGGAREAQSQAELQDQMARFNFGQQEPTSRLANYMAMLQGGNLGGTQTNTTYGGSGFNPVLGALGVGAAGTGILQNLFGGANPLMNNPFRG